MGRKKVTGRANEAPDARASTSSRVYVDTIKKLKYVADLDNVSIADLIDRLARAEFLKRRAELLRDINALAGESGAGGE